MTSTTLDTPTAQQLARAYDLLTSANKWIRRIEERSEDLPASFLDNVDVTPLRRSIDEFIEILDVRLAALDGHQSGWKS